MLGRRRRRRKIGRVRRSLRRASCGLGCDGSHLVGPGGASAGVPGGVTGDCENRHREANEADDHEDGANSHDVDPYDLEADPEREYCTQSYELRLVPVVGVVTEFSSL